MKFLLTLIIFCFTVSFESVSAMPAPETDSVPKKNLQIVAEIQVLKTTHRNLFKGGDIIINYRLARWAIGLGMEYAFSSYHHDNGYKLFDLHFVPVFIDSRLYFPTQNFLRYFLEFSSGISFIKYEKEDRPGSPHYLVFERGIYLYVGGSMSFYLKSRYIPFLGLGFKGFHLSGNVYDVNPHGMNFRIGTTF